MRRQTGRLDRRDAGGVIYYRSPRLERLGIDGHGFSTRLGGVSAGPFASLNLGHAATGRRDEPANVEQNWRRFLAAARLGSDGRRHEVEQVHGAAVALRGGKGERADAIVSEDALTPVCVRAADCCPILLARGDGFRVAAVHAGWRGLVAGVVEAAVHALKGRRQDVVAAVGPCIGLDAFEVGPEVLDCFSDKFGDAAPLRRDGPGDKGHVDLCGSAVLALARAGVAIGNIDAGFLCTVENEVEFFSHRRDRGVTGRLAAAIRANG